MKEQALDLRLSLVESLGIFLNDSGLSSEMNRELKSMKPLSEDLT
jgi:hypothetical protein